MGSVELQESAGERPVERRMVASCLLCKIELLCPNDAEEWSWSRSDAVKAFQAEHLAHGSPSTVGAHFTYVEKA